MTNTLCNALRAARLVHCVHAAVLLALAGHCATASAQVTQAFTATAAIQTFTVPADITQLTIDAKGAQGGNATSTGAGVGGNGAEVAVTVSVTPGEITAAGPGGGPHVRVFDGATGREILGLFAFDPAFAGGAFVAAPPPVARMAVESPTADASISGSVRITGWAVQQTSLDAVGDDVMNAWAFPAGGGAPVWVGGASVATARPDVASTFGDEFLTSGFDVTAPLAPGEYYLVVLVRNTRTQIFDQRRIVHITVH